MEKGAYGWGLASATEPCSLFSTMSSGIVTYYLRGLAARMLMIFGERCSMLIPAAQR